MNLILAACIIAVMYIIFVSLLIFNIEPYSFNTFLDALYCSTIMLTTIGFGDIVCVSTAGRVIEVISSIFGLIIMGIPSSIIVVSYVMELNNFLKNKRR